MASNELSRCTMWNMYIKHNTHWLCNGTRVSVSDMSVFETRYIYQQVIWQLLANRISAIDDSLLPVNMSKWYYSLLPVDVCKWHDSLLPTGYQQLVRQLIASRYQHVIWQLIANMISASDDSLLPTEYQQSYMTAYCQSISASDMLA